jgi:hypothetical protein
MLYLLKLILQYFKEIIKILDKYKIFLNNTEIDIEIILMTNTYITNTD